MEPGVEGRGTEKLKREIYSLGEKRTDSEKKEYRKQLLAKIKLLWIVDFCE